jgi:GT2 family glycosyltransferase
MSRAPLNDPVQRAVERRTGSPDTISVIIPNWNGAHHLKDCLASLKAQTLGGFETVIVDNGSNDDSVALLERDHTWARIIQLPENAGFSAAVNAGIRATRSDLVVLLNNDTRVETDWLEKLVEALRAQPQASFAACKMLQYEPPHRIDAAGDRFSLLTGVGWSIGLGEPAESHDQPGWVFGACAGAAIYRRSLFDDIGLFDEDFFLVFEDVDLSLRAQAAGHGCLYVPEAIVYHKRGGSTDNASMAVAVRTWRNAIWVAGKNLPALLLTWWFALFALKLGRLVIRSVFFRFWFKLRPPRTKAPQTMKAPPPGERKHGVLLDLYWPALREAMSTLPNKRRQLRPLRRRNSLTLLPVLLRPWRPLHSSDRS